MRCARILPDYETAVVAPSHKKERHGRDALNSGSHRNLMDEDDLKERPGRECNRGRGKCAASRVQPAP